MAFVQERHLHLSGSILAKDGHTPAYWVMWVHADAHFYAGLPGRDMVKLEAQRVGRSDIYPETDTRYEDDGREVQVMTWRCQFWDYLPRQPIVDPPIIVMETADDWQTAVIRACYTIFDGEVETWRAGIYQECVAWDKVSQDILRKMWNGEEATNE